MGPVTTPLLDAVTALVGDRFTVEREIGRGGMGAVFLARERALERPVAIKVLPPELAARPDLRERFLRETRTAAGFSHPHIVPVHSVEERDGLLCFVMGYVEGETLAARVRRAGPLGAAEAARLLREVAWALSYAHGRGVVHRDVKPDNILIERATGRALVTDFGIAKAAGPALAGANGGRAPLTTVGEVVGTPQFMSPEQAAGDAVDGRSDLYSLGIVAFFALTGRLPFGGGNTQALLAQQLTQPPPDLGALRPDLPAALVAPVMRCLAKDPALRLASGEALVEALDAMRAAQPDVAPAVRVFEQRAENALRGVVTLACLLPIMTSALTRDGAVVDAQVFSAFIVAIIAGIVGSVISAARELVRKGFRYEDVRDGVRAIAAEQRDYCAALRAAPGDDARRRTLRWRRAAGALAGGALVAYAQLRMRRPAGGGRYTMSAHGAAVGMLGMALVALALVSTVADPRRASVWERLGAGFWASPLGRLLFRVAARGAGPAHPTAGPARTALAVLDDLPREQRASLTDVRAAIARLEADAAALAAREAELDGALREAHAAAPPPAAVDPGRRAALLDDLVRARREAGERRAALVSTLENARLQLLRFRSGLATPDEVAAEVGERER
jgi:serine/threonine-protein kinase